MGQMDRSGTEDLGLVARLLYGYILSNSRILCPSESSFVLIAGLIPQDVRHMILNLSLLAQPFPESPKIEKILMSPGQRSIEGTPRRGYSSR